MTNSQRIEVLQLALDHQFDVDDNAPLVLSTEDPLLRAAVAVINSISAYTDVTIGPNEEFFVLLAAAIGVDTGEGCSRP